MELANFWKCISILLGNYHAINRKIFACKLGKVFRIVKGIEKINSTDILQIRNDHGNLDIQNNSPDLQICDSSEEELSKTLQHCCYTNNCEGYLILLKFLTKNDEANVEAVGMIDFQKTQYTCTFQSATFDDFQVTLHLDDLDVSVLTNRKEEGELNRWADFVLKPKLIKWSCSTEKKENVFTSLHLIDIEVYNELYKELKTKYSKNIIDIWEESTDPNKFVFEDLAIAAYLICLWKKHQQIPKAFADLGCGNGLLVYILNQEGYHGYGYDVRCRRIWSHYPKTTLLIEKTITPDCFKLPADVDWIIGNHSDELSPWIPVISTLASYEMKYFLLPCCPFEFSGKKFQRRNSKQSSYNDFLNYTENISKKCGFLTLRDRLKIPSTKRIAFIGISRTYTKLSHSQNCSAIKEFLTTEQKETSLRLREKIEVVRNCTQIDSAILNDVVKKIFLYLLRPQNQATSSWNAGSQSTIKDLVQCLSPEDLKIMKSECGGLKTLLKNKHEIFELCPYDKVQIRKPKPKDPCIAKTLTIKKRPCYFASNHPNGCPLTDADCTFIHA